MTSYAPHLFVRNIAKTVRRSDLWKVFTNLEFGIIDNIVVKQGDTTNSAIVYYEQWDLDQTQCTRKMLKNGKSLTITYAHDSLANGHWKVYAFDETRIIRNLSETLHPNVTDNRKQRMRCDAPPRLVRNAHYSNEYLDELRVNLFPFDYIVSPNPNSPKSTIHPDERCFAPIKQQRLSYTDNDDVAEVARKLF